MASVHRTEINTLLVALQIFLVCCLPFNVLCFWHLEAWHFYILKYIPLSFFDFCLVFHHLKVIYYYLISNTCFFTFSRGPKTISLNPVLAWTKTKSFLKQTVLHVCILICKKYAKRQQTFHWRNWVNGI